MIEIVFHSKEHRGRIDAKADFENGTVADDTFLHNFVVYNGKLYLNIKGQRKIHIIDPALRGDEKNYEYMQKKWAAKFMEEYSRYLAEKAILGGEQ